MPHTLYLDSRDLINVIAWNRPLSPPELRNALTERDTCLVYSFSNVLETVDFGDENEIRRRLELLDSFPKSFVLGLPPLIKIEFTQALMAFFGKMRRTFPVIPFRAQWHQTFSSKPLPLLRQSLVDVVVHVLTDNPGIGRNTEARRQFVMREVDIDRTFPAAERRSWERFRNGVANTLRRFGFRALTMVELESFCQWLSEHGDACPGWRVFIETHYAFTDNVRDRGQRGDAPDYSHVIAVPYVESATLDNRMRGYYGSALRKLARQYPNNQYFTDRVLPNLEGWL